MIAAAKKTKKSEPKKTATKATKPKKVKSKDDLAEAADLLKRIEKQEKLCQACAANVTERREELQQAKAAYGDAVATLRRLCRARSETHPLFDQKKAEGEKAEAPATAPADGPKPVAANWRAVTVASLKFKKGVGDKLEAAGLSHLGDLVDYMHRHGVEWWRSLQGIAAATAEGVFQTVADYWANNPEAAKAREAELDSLAASRN